MHCMLVLPGVLTRDPRKIEKLATLALPALQRLLARGLADSGAWTGMDAWLLDEFEVERQEDWPNAPFALLGEGETPGDNCWVHADPVSLRADRNSLLLADAALLNIQPDEARAIVETLNAHYGDELGLCIATPDRWYARIQSPPKGETTPLSSVAGRPIEPGRGAMGWHALMNEMQMLLHDHPVNEAREARGEATINGVWLWGAGRLAPVTTAYSSVASSLPLARGLARHAGIGTADLPANARHWLAGTAGAGVRVCVHDALQTAAKSGSDEAWFSALVAMERDWIVPLVEALEDERLGMLTLKLGGETSLHSFEATRQDLRRFWRRPKPLDRNLADNTKDGE